MKLTARLLILLVLAGILVLSVPSMAGERAGAKPQVVQLQSSTDVAAPTFMESVMLAVKAQTSVVAAGRSDAGSQAGDQDDDLRWTGEERHRSE